MFKHSRHWSIHRSWHYKHETFGKFVTELNFKLGKSRHLQRSNLVHMWILTRPIILYWQTADMGITEHIEGDECKFAAWTGRTPVVENKMILKVSKIPIESYWDNIVFHYLYRPLPSKQSNCGSKSCVSSSRRLTLIPPCRPSSPNPHDFQGKKQYTCV